MSNSVFQSVMLQLKDISDRTFGVIDSDGCVISCTDGLLLGERLPDAALKISGAADNVVSFGQRTFKAILSGTGYCEYAVFCSGDDEVARTLCAMAYIALNDAEFFAENSNIIVTDLLNCDDVAGIIEAVNGAEIEIQA